MRRSCWGLASASVASHCLLLCVLGTLCHGQTCHSTGPDQNSRCSSSEACGHRRRVEDGECTGPFPPFPARPVTQFCSTQCRSYSQSNALDILNNPILSVSATFYSTSWLVFAVNISWDHPYNPAEGYRLIIRDEFKFLVGCFCINESDSTSIQLVSGFFEYRARNSFNIELSMIHNLPNVSTPPVTRPYKWPKTCLDIIHMDSTCALPVYHKPTDLRVNKKSTESGNQTIFLRWSYTYETSFPLPSVYYIELEGRNAGVHYFIIYNTSRVTNSATLTQLNDSVTYRVTIRPYVRCSGLANRTFSLGCGKASPRVFPSEFPISPSSSVLEESPSISPTSVTPSQTLSPMPTATIKAVPPSPLRLNWKRTTGISVGIGVFIVLTVISLVGISIRACKRRKPLPWPSPTPSQDRTFSVFVVYAPKTSSEKYIHTYVVCRLKEYFDVVTSSDVMRGDTMKWIEECERTADAVLLVCTKEFHLEWEEKEAKSLVVTAVQTLLSSAVVQERLDKYAIIVLDDKSRQACIPDNHYLSNVGIYVIGKQRNQLVIDELRRFVTKQAMFEHRTGCNDRDRSPSSVPSSIGSSDLKSQCTESVNLGSSVGSEGYSASHELDILGADKDTPVTIQACVHSEPNLRSDSGLQSQQVHQLLTFLQEPNVDPDTAPLDSHSGSLNR